MPTELYDIAVIGGGINGCGIARDAAGRGLKVLLVEQNDLASGTSSMSTKLIHGGLRYLEHYEFRLVRESLIEREILWQMAPHIIEPIRFVLPHHRALRPAWLIRLGLYMYDHIGGRKRLPPSHGLDLAIDPAGQPLNKKFRRGFEYSDCRVDDARLVILNAMDARARGADIYTRTKMRSARLGAGRDGAVGRSGWGHQWLRHCQRCCRARPQSLTGRAERSGQRHLVNVNQTHSWRPALFGTL